MAAIFTKPKSFNTFLWLYFSTGLLLGLIIGCALTLMFAFSSLTITNYYYYYDGKTYQIHNTLPQVGSNGKIIEGKSYRPPSNSPYPNLKETQHVESTLYDVHRLSNAHNYLKGFPVMDVAVILIVGEKCDVLDDQTYLESWGSSVSLFLIINEKCTIKTTLKDKAKLWNLSIHYYTYTKDSLSVYQLMYKVHSELSPCHHWIALIAPDTYLNVLNMNTLLNEFNYNDNHMFGMSDKNSRQYCSNNGPVLVLSKSVLNSLMTISKSCLNHASISAMSVLTTVSQCCVDTLHVICSSHLKIINDFKEHHVNSISTLNNLTDTLALYPISISHNLHKLHHHFVITKYNQTQIQLDTLASIIKVLANHSTTLDKFSPDQYPLQIGTENEITWDYFDENFMYSDQHSEARYPFREYKNELNTVLLEIVRLANIDYHAPLVFNKIINGYMSRNEDGTRYIIDVELQEIYSPHSTLRRRFSLLRPFRLNYITFPSKSVIDEVIHMIVPIHDVGVRLSGFFKTFEDLFDDLKDRIHLIMVVYNQKDKKQCKEFAKKYQTSSYPMLSFTIVQGKGQFSRARALDAGTEILNNSDLMFFCDVDLDIRLTFFERCKLNTIAGKQVYYPEVFKLYNMDYAYRYSLKPQSYDTVRKNGHWGYYGYGMVCMYKSDYIKVGGLDTSFIGWGGEDLEFHRRVYSKGYNILRAPDPALKHPWHQKVCDLLDKRKQAQCIGSQSEVLADRSELGRYVYELEKNKSHLFCI